jgi:hypothetical protein
VRRKGTGPDSMDSGIEECRRRRLFVAGVLPRRAVEASTSRSQLGSRTRGVLRWLFVETTSDRPVIASLVKAAALERFNVFVHIPLY